MNPQRRVSDQAQCPITLRDPTPEQRLEWIASALHGDAIYGKAWDDPLFRLAVECRAAADRSSNWSIVPGIQFPPGTDFTKPLGGGNIPVGTEPDNAPPSVAASIHNQNCPADDELYNAREAWLETLSWEKVSLMDQLQHVFDAVRCTCLTPHSAWEVWARPIGQSGTRFDVVREMEQICFSSADEDQALAIRDKMNLEKSP